MEISEKDAAYAVKMLDAVCAAMDDMKLKYSRSDEDMAVFLSFDGADFPMKIIYRILPAQHLVLVYSPLSFNVPEDGRTNVALAITMVNDRIYDGMWTENLATGQVTFCVTNSYNDSIIGKECLKSMLSLAMHFTDDLADKLFMVGKGNMTLQQFCEAVFEDN